MTLASIGLPEDVFVDPETRSTDQRAWSAFVRLELMGPLDGLVGLLEVFGQEAAGKRPEDFLADVGKAQLAAQRLLTFARELLDPKVNESLTLLTDDLRRARHDLGNRLHQVSGLVQLLQMQEESLFGAFLADLEKMAGLCRQCESRLLQQSEKTQVSSTAEPVAGLTEPQIQLLVEQIQPVHDSLPRSAAEVGDILITDDDPLNREVLRRMLEHHGHRVHEAANGHEALRLLEERTFDLLLLDILMPGLNGFQVLQRLREGGRLQRTSVIVISALAEVHNSVRCLEEGAEDYLSKPVDRVLLRARINSCLVKRRQRARELEQFFPPEVVAQLLDRPELLHTGRTADVTVLFGDIRGFSRVSERLQSTPEKMVEWVSAVMEALSECVLRHQGVLVDFIGDELVAMWGAPQAQPDHAQRACRATLDMLACLPRLSSEWEGLIGEATAVGIGLNSGPVSVGNTGTKRRFKYGPLGNTVNLASRIQGATKYLKAPALLTEATRVQLGDEFALRRLSNLQVVNIKEPVAVYELTPPDQPAWSELKAAYESALTLFERGPAHLQESANILGALVPRFGLSGPNLFLMSRILGAMQDPHTWSGVYVLPGK
jgi:adenylate cyclase